MGDSTRVSVSYKNLTNDVEVGKRLLIDDGLIELRVEKVSANNIECTVINGGTVSSNKGINVPHDISVAGYDGIVMASQLQPQLTTYKQDTIHIGQLAAIQLISLIEKPKATIIKQYLTKGNLIEGGSVARLQV